MTEDASMKYYYLEIDDIFYGSVLVHVEEISSLVVFMSPRYTDIFREEFRILADRFRMTWMGQCHVS